MKVTTSPPNKPTRGWRRSRHLRRVKRPRQGGTTSDPETLRFPYRIRCKNPFFECSFHEILDEFFTKIVEKGAAKKVRRHQTSDRQTESGRSRAAPGSCFGQPKRRYHSQKPPKRVPKTGPGILLRTRLKGTSGLPRSFHSPQMAPAAQ